MALFKKGQGGRPPGAKNKLTLARQQLRQEALRRLNEDLPADAFDGDAIGLFQRIYKDPAFDAELRLEAAAKIAAFERKDAAAETEQRYVAVMPLPVKDLDEWRKMYMDYKPDASPEDVQYHEKLAEQVIDNQKGLTLADKAPWLDRDKKDEPSE